MQMAWELMEEEMEIRYKRDLNSNYMILTDKDPLKETYEIRMITENRIYGFLPCVSQRHENTTEYYYEITGRQSMELLYERRKLNCEQLKSLLRELLRILESAEEYLLNPDHFVLRPESIYLHTRTEKLCLCYYTGYEKAIRESFLELAEYLLGKLDKNDPSGIEFGYELYQNALEQNFSLPEILHKHAEPREELPTPMEPAVPVLSVQEEVLEKTGSWKNFFKKKPRKSQLEDYVMENDPMQTGSAVFLKEQESGYIQETTFLRPEKQEGLFLRSLNADYSDLQIAIKDGNYLLGKMRESVDGCIPASTVSRIHARVYFDGSAYYIEDLNSTNGTWVNQTQLNPYELFPLENGMRIVFASVEYEVRL